MGAEATKNKINYGGGSYIDMDELSRQYNISIESVEELKRKFLIYRGRNGKINIHNYVIFYKEYVNMNANDIEIYKSCQMRRSSALFRSLFLVELIYLYFLNSLSKINMIIKYKFSI